MKKRLDKKKKKIGSEKITTVCSWPITAIPTYQSLSSKVIIDKTAYCVRYCSSKHLVKIA